MWNRIASLILIVGALLGCSGHHKILERKSINDFSCNYHANTIQVSGYCNESSMGYIGYQLVEEAKGKRLLIEVEGLKKVGDGNFNISIPLSPKDEYISLGESGTVVWRR